MRDMGAGSGGGNSGRYWRDGILYSPMNDPKYGHLMPDGTPDTRWQTSPIRGMSNVGNFLGDAMLGGQEAVQGAMSVWDTVKDYVQGADERLDASPLSATTRPTAAQQELRMYNPHHDTSYIQPEGYERMANEGYDSWSPDDGIPEKYLGDALPYMTGVLGRGELEPNIREDWDMLSPSIQDMLARELATQLAQQGLELTLESAKELIQEKRKKNNNFTVGMLDNSRYSQYKTKQSNTDGPLSFDAAINF
jgi:hypothetical protein